MDVLLDLEGDLKTSGHGDIILTNSIRQAIRIRLLWFFSEWRFEPGWGIPYFEQVFVKNPNMLRIRAIIRNEIMAVEGVDGVRSITISVDTVHRSAIVSFVVSIGNEDHGDEVTILEKIWTNT